MQSVFRFKQFELKHGGSGMKLTTDSLLLGAWVEPAIPPRTIVDAGSGCGILALMCAQRFTQARITAIDISPDAFAESCDNFTASPWSDRLSAVNSDIEAWADKHDDTVDLIICNPPYFTETLRSPDAARADARHAGTLSAENIIALAARLLSPDGTLALVIPYSHIPRLSLPASLASLYITRIAEVSARCGKDPSLALIQLSHKVPDNAPVTELIYIRDSAGDFNTTYRRLTLPFLLYDKKA